MQIYAIVNVQDDVFFFFFHSLSLSPLLVLRSRECRQGPPLADGSIPVFLQHLLCFSCLPPVAPAPLDRCLQGVREVDCSHDRLAYDL